MIKERLRLQIGNALQACFEKGSLDSGEVPEIQVEVPANPEHGDFASNLAMTMARAEKKAPRQIAEALAGELAKHEFVLLLFYRGLW